MEVVDDAPNGSLGWQKFEQHRPQLVITDIVMPEMDGIELAKKIKAAAPDTAILFLSCHRDFVYAKSGIQIGVHDYIVKTDMDDEYMGQALQQVRHQFDQQAIRRQAESGTASSSSVASSSPETTSKRDELLGNWLHHNSYAAKQQLLRQLQAEWSWMLSKCYMLFVYFPEQGEGGRIPSLHNHWEHIVADSAGQIHYVPIDGCTAVVVCHQSCLSSLQSSLVERIKRI